MLSNMHNLCVLRGANYVRFFFMCIYAHIPFFRVIGEWLQMHQYKKRFLRETNCI